MDLTLDQALTIIGRLDDSPGFDTPRERFRRFLKAQVTTLDTARDLIRQCRQGSGEQPHRALHDTIVLTGRFLGFDVAFGRYQHDPGAAPEHGNWLLRRRLAVTVIVCSDQTADIDLDDVSRHVAEGSNGTPRVGLLVTTAFYASKARLARALHAGRHGNLRLISLDGLLRLCAMVADGRLSQAEVLQVLNPGMTLDSQLGLLERVTVQARGETPLPARDRASTSPERPPEPRGRAGAPGVERNDRRYWVNALRVESFARSERAVTSLIATRQILGINPAPGSEDRVRPGDRICVFVDGRGIVAHAEVAGVLAAGTRMIRDPQRYRHVLRLTNVTVLSAPMMPGPELGRKMALALASETPNVTMPISPREFDAISTPALSHAG